LAELQRLLGALPAWLSGIGGATEDLDWLNVLLAEVRLMRARACVRVRVRA
jgi:hypothetical protein